PPQVRKHKKISAREFCSTRSTTKLPPPLVTKSCCALGSAKPLGTPSSDSRKTGGIVMASSCQKREPCGARSMRKPAGRCACQRKGAHNFPSESGSYPEC